MGSIFGIADLPVDTIADAVKINSNGQVPAPVVSHEVSDFGKSVKGTNLAPLSADVVQLPRKRAISNSIIKMRNGFGKLMSHFSGIKPKHIIK